MTRTIAIAALATAALAAAGCGSDGSPEDQIRSTFAQATSALKDGKGAEFCDALTPTTAKSIAESGKQTTGASDCPKVVDNLLSAAQALRTQDWPKFCDSIGKQSADQIAASGKALKAKGNTCADAAEAIGKTPQGKQVFTATADQLDSALNRLVKGKLDKITINGDKATATVTPKQPNDQPVTFEKIDGSWRIATTAAGGSTPAQ
jgi:hypothetical protein